MLVGARCGLGAGLEGINLIDIMEVTNRLDWHGRHHCYSPYDDTYARWRGRGIGQLWV